MTREEILAVEAGDELDRLVATEVMGEPMPEFVPGNNLDLQLAGSPLKSPYGNWLCLCKYEEGDIPTWHPQLFSTDISAAWPVVEKLAKENLFCSLDYLREQHWRDGRGDWRCRVVRGVKIEFAVAKEAPEAICKAALLAKLEVGSA